MSQVDDHIPAACRNLTPDPQPVAAQPLLRHRQNGGAWRLAEQRSNGRPTDQAKECLRIKLGKPIKKPRRKDRIADPCMPNE